ncbi:hypothetical protein [Trichocoleus sp. DQ-U1]|uniref:hypothetical protein n=1 Tax=Trichocoleus sp. DQ-U1 TaxID=2933926 RepID=UPI0032989976
MARLSKTLETLEKLSRSPKHLPQGSVAGAVERSPNSNPCVIQLLHWQDISQ